MLSGDGNENSEKKKQNYRSNYQKNKKKLCTCSTLLFCTTTTLTFQKLPSYTFYGGNIVYVPVGFISLPLIFPLVAAIAFLIFSPPLKSFMYRNRSQTVHKSKIAVRTARQFDSLSEC